MFILDLDDTLLDTQGFKEVRIHALNNLGVSASVYNKSYKEAYSNANGINTYNDDAHAEVLATYGFDRELIKQAFDSVRSRLKGFLFPDAIDFLQFLKDINQQVILLSLGQSDFQKMKIDSTEIAEYFDQIFITNNSKQEILEKIISQHANESEIWFVNDKPSEIKNILLRFPALKPILKISKRFTKAEYKAVGIPYFSTLIEIKQYVEQQLK
jgi:FMN phosphatase YigB (HAD superfamily)